MFLFEKQTVGMGGRFADAGSPFVQITSAGLPPYPRSLQSWIEAPCAALPYFVCIVRALLDPFRRAVQIKRFFTAYDFHFV